MTARARIVLGIAALAPWICCRNAGIEAWNPVQEVAQWFRRPPASRLDRVVLTLHNNDFTYTPVALITERGFTISAPGVQAAFSPALYRWSYLYRLYVNARYAPLFAPDDQPAMAALVEQSLIRLRTDLQQRSVDFALLLLPPFVEEACWRPEERESRRLAIQLCERLGVRWIDLWEPVRQLLELGVDVSERPGDRWHPDDTAGRAMAFHALQHGLLPEWYCSARTATYAARAGQGEQRIELDLGPAHAGCDLRLCGSRSGFAPGFVVDDVRVSCNADTYLAGVLAAPDERLGSPPGRLDANGRAVVQLRVPDLESGVPVLLHHVLVALREGRVVAATNPVPLWIVP